MEERFSKIYSQGKLAGVQILVDTKTGVHYVFAFSGYAGGMTVLLDENGKPVISPEYRKYDPLHGFEK